MIPPMVPPTIAPVGEPLCLLLAELNPLGFDGLEPEDSKLEVDIVVGEPLTRAGGF